MIEPTAPDSSLPPPIIGPADQFPLPYPATDDCLSSGTTRWTVMPCVPALSSGAPDISTVVTTPHVRTTLPATGIEAGLVTIAVFAVLLGVLARSAARRRM